MQVTFVDHTAAPGGAELSLARYLEWTERGLEVNVILLEDGYLRAVAEDAGVTVVYPKEPLRSAQSKRRWLSAQRKFFGAVVVANSLNSALLLATIRKESHRYVYYLREDLSPQWLSIKRRLVTVGFALQRFDALISNSEWTQSTIPVALRRKPQYICYPICGVGEISGPPEPVDGTLRLLSLSRFAEWKGIDVVVDAIHLARTRTPVKLDVTLAGADLFEDDDFGHRLEQQVLMLNPPAHVPGHVEDVASLLRTHDVLLHGSRRAEPFGQVVVQGLANGLVVVATDAGGPAEVLKSGKNGILVDPGSVESMADAIVELAADHEKRQRIAAAGQERAQDFLDEEACIALEKVLRREVELSRGGEA